MTQTLLFMLGFAFGALFIADRMHTSAEIEEAVLTAYRLGQNECPAERVCIRDDIGLMPLDITMVEEIIQ